MANYDSIISFWQKQKVSNAAELSVLLQTHSVAFAYNSGKIENDKITFHDTREVFDKDGVTSYTGDLRTLFEIRNAKDAYEFILQAFDQKQAITEDFVKELQKQLTKWTYDTRRYYELHERPGEYKKNDYVTGRDEVGALADDVSDEMNELLDELHSVDDKHALTAAAYFHSKFENIHPFADGNGRTGRLLMNYFLLQHNHPPIIIHEEDRKTYYSALESFDKNLDIMPLRNFLIVQLEKTWSRTIDRTLNSQTTHTNTLKDLITTADTRKSEKYPNFQPRKDDLDR